MDRDDEMGPDRGGLGWDEVRDDERGMEGGYTTRPDLDALARLRPEARPSRPPRGYQRADERIRDDVYDRLCGRTGADASDVTVTVHEGEVTLTGTVPTRDDKRRIEVVAEQVLGVKDIFNRLRVVSPA